MGVLVELKENVVIILNHLILTMNVVMNQFVRNVMLLNVVIVGVRVAVTCRNTLEVDGS